MEKSDSATEIFESQFVDNIAVAHLKGLALGVLTRPQGSKKYFDFLGSVNDSPDVLGYVQINDSKWDSHSAVDALVDLMLKDSDPVLHGSRYYGFQHDMIAARFRNSMGRALLTMVRLTKPAIAGMQGRISAEYLGFTLAFDSRIATADTTFSFDSMRTGLPASTGVTFLMPRYIGIGRTMSLIQNGSTIDAREALSLGLISDIVETRQELTERCVKDIQVVTATPHRHLLKYHRQHVLPPASEMETALERYYDAMARSIIQLRMNR